MIATIVDVCLGVAVVGLAVSLAQVTRILLALNKRVYQMRVINRDLSWRIYRALSTHGNMPLPTFEIWHKSLYPREGQE